MYGYRVMREAVPDEMRKFIGGRKSGQRNDKKKLGVRKGASRQLVGVLVMNLLDVIQGCKEDIE